MTKVFVEQPLAASESAKECPKPVQLSLFYDWKHNFKPFGRDCTIKSWEEKSVKLTE